MSDGLHACAIPTCSRRVEPLFPMCRQHWFILPKVLRRKIWKLYIPGQELHPERISPGWTDVIDQAMAIMSEPSENAG